MTIGSLGIIGGLAGTPLPQRATDSDKQAHDAGNQERAMQAGERAEQAAGIGQTEEDSQTDQRDADGRRPWEQLSSSREESPDAATQPAAAWRVKDPTGACGGQLDLVG